MRNLASDVVVRRLLVALLALFPLAFSFQGADPTDFGLAAAGARFVFSHPDSVSTSFIWWLTLVITGVWEWLLGPTLGAYSLRAAYVAEVWLTLFIVYRILREGVGVGANAACVALAPALLFFQYDEQGALNWMHYNDLTATFYVVAVALFLRGAQTGARGYYVAAGAVLGLNPFLRFPNAAGLMLIPVWLAFDRRDLRTKLLASVGGVTLGVGLGLLLALALGQASMVWSTWQGALAGGLGLEDHPPRELLFQQIVATFRLVPIALYGACVVLLVTLLSRFALRWPLWARILIALATVIELSLLGIKPLHQLFRGMMIFATGTLSWIQWTPAGYVLLALVAASIEERRRSTSSLSPALLAAGLFVFLVTPLGSNRLMLNFHFGGWLAVAVTTALIWESEPLGGLDRARWNWIKRTLLGATLLGLFVSNWNVVARDARRTELRHRVPEARMGMILTTQARAQSMSDFAAATKRLLPRHGELLALEQLQLLHYIADARPFLGTPAPGYLKAIEIEKRLNLALAAGRAFPPLVTSKGFPGSDWATPQVVHTEGRDRIHAIGVDLLSRGKYRLAWEDHFLQLWLPDRPKTVKP